MKYLIKQINKTYKHNTTTVERNEQFRYQHRIVAVMRYQSLLELFDTKPFATSEYKLVPTPLTLVVKELTCRTGRGPVH